MKRKLLATLLVFSHLCVFAGRGEHGAWAEVNGTDTTGPIFGLIVIIVIVILFIRAECEYRKNNKKK